MQTRKRKRGGPRRRAAAAVQVLVLSTVILGMGALAVDLGALFTSQAELQSAADAAALAAAARLAGAGGEDPTAAAAVAADEYARRNPVRGTHAGVEAGDVEFGRALYDPASGRFRFQPGGTNFDAVRVTLRRAQGTEGGPTALLFARIFGRATVDLRAHAAAVLIPRDIALVIDLSNSMCYDSQLRFWNRSDGGYSNLRDVWCALDGPLPDRPYLPGPETDTGYAADSGPTFGELNEWGAPLLPGAYDPAADPGLWYIPKYTNCTVPAARTRLAARGYSPAEVTALLSAAQDGAYADQWRNRVGVILGLATWHSGKPGGLDPAGGNGNDVLGNAEVVWQPQPAFAGNWTWANYIEWARTSSTGGSAFRSRFGLKTLMDFVLDQRPEAGATDGLCATPQEPLRAVKDAVQLMIDTIVALESLDRVALEVFATSARHEVDLTDNLQLVADALYLRQSGHYDRTTNIGGGLARAIAELTSERARGVARKVIVLMSDGVANVDANGNYVGDGHPAARNYALAMARQAADLGFRIYTVSVGYAVDRALLQEIAALGGGQEFYAAGSPETYTEQLALIFRTLGGKRPVALIE